MNSQFVCRSIHLPYFKDSEKVNAGSIRRSDSVGTCQIRVMVNEIDGYAYN